MHTSIKSDILLLVYRGNKLDVHFRSLKWMTIFQIMQSMRRWLGCVWKI